MSSHGSTNTIRNILVRQTERRTATVYRRESIQTRVGTFNELAEQIRSVRRAVFVQEQGVAESEEFDGSDEECEHVVVLRDGRAVATGRVDGTGRMGRIAVLCEARGTGIGSTVTRALEMQARQLGCTRVWMHAQVQATGFYEKLGYAATGPEFMEAGIAHRFMVKPLTRDQSQS